MCQSGAFVRLASKHRLLQIRAKQKNKRQDEHACHRKVAHAQIRSHMQNRKRKRKNQNLGLGVEIPQALLAALLSTCCSRPLLLLLLPLLLLRSSSSSSSCCCCCWCGGLFCRSVACTRGIAPPKANEPQCIPPKALVQANTFALPALCAAAACAALRRRWAHRPAALVLPRCAARPRRECCRWKGEG